MRWPAFATWRSASRRPTDSTSCCTTDRTSGGPIIRIHLERIISFGIDETDTPAHSLTVNARDVEH